LPLAAQTPDGAIRFLNELLDLDRDAVQNLFQSRVPCGDGLADHPTVQVRVRDDGNHVGPLGLLGGLFGCDRDGWPAVTMAVVQACRTCGHTSELKGLVSAACWSPSCRAFGARGPQPFIVRFQRRDGTVPGGGRL